MSQGCDLRAYNGYNSLVFWGVFVWLDQRSSYTICD
jgi:hypothetical protein